MAMSGKGILKFLITLVLTVLLVAACWYIWQETPRLIRRTPLQDYRHLVSVLAIYLMLSLLNPLISKAWSRIFAEGDGDEKSS